MLTRMHPERHPYVPILHTTVPAPGVPPVDKPGLSGTVVDVYGPNVIAVHVEHPEKIVLSSVRIRWRYLPVKIAVTPLAIRL